MYTAEVHYFFLATLPPFFIAGFATAAFALAILSATKALPRSRRDRIKQDKGQRKNNG
jgi:hypothetical protein